MWNQLTKQDRREMKSLIGDAVARGVLTAGLVMFVLGFVLSIALHAVGKGG